MVRQEHIHIISAGEHIYTSYAATIRDHADITRTFIFADTELYTNNARDEGAIRAQKEAARESVTMVRSFSASLKIPSLLVYVTPPADASVKDAVQKIRKDHPGAKFSLDLSAGSKDLSIALFAISLWLEADAYYAFRDRKGEGTAAKLPVPKVPAGSVAANQNYTRILRILSRQPGKEERSPRVLPRHYIFTQMESFYVPVRKKGVRIAENRAGKTDLHTGKKALIPILSQGTYSNILSTMKALDLIQEVPGPDNNRKEKYYCITPSGELALQLAEITPRTP